MYPNNQTAQAGVALQLDTSDVEKSENLKEPLRSVINLDAFFRPMVADAKPIRPDGVWPTVVFLVHGCVYLAHGLGVRTRMKNNE